MVCALATLHPWLFGVPPLLLWQALPPALLTGLVASFVTFSLFRHGMLVAIRPLIHEAEDDAVERVYRPRKRGSPVERRAKPLVRWNVTPRSRVERGGSASSAILV